MKESKDILKTILKEDEMKKLLLIILIIFCANCGPDCPPCPDESGNLNIPAEHWEMIKCAGPEWTEYVREYVHCAYFQDEIIRNGKSYGGWSDFECDDIFIRNYDNIYAQYRTIIHETAHLETHSGGESYSLQKEKEFKDAVNENLCYDFE